MRFRERASRLNWCIPAGSLSGVRIGIHWTFPVAFVLYTAVESARHGALWGLTVGLIVVALFLIVLAHEFGHVFAARREGCPTEKVMLWPLGGLAFLGEERLGLSEVRIAAAGPAVNLVLFFAFVPLLLVAGVPMGLHVANPFEFWIPRAADTAPGFGPDLLYGVSKANLVLLLFNLIPAFPIDGGRILRGLLHGRLGPVRSLLVTTTVSLAFCAAMLAAAIVFANLLLGIIAVLVAIGAWQTRKQVLSFAAMEQEESGFLGYDFSLGHTSLERGPLADPRATRREEREQRRREREEKRERRRVEEEKAREKEIEEQVDRLLEKISREGIDSLTKGERAFLEKASRRMR